MSTPKNIIESTIGRGYEAKKLMPPQFKVERIDFTTGRSLEQVLSSLAKPSTTAENTFRKQPKKAFKLTNILSYFKIKVA